MLLVLGLFSWIVPYIFSLWLAWKSEIFLKNQAKKDHNLQFAGVFFSKGTFSQLSFWLKKTIGAYNSCHHA